MTLAQLLRTIAARYEALLRDCPKGCERPCQECISSVHLLQNSHEQPGQQFQATCPKLDHKLQTIFPQPNLKQAVPPVQ